MGNLVWGAKTWQKCSKPPSSSNPGSSDGAKWGGQASRHLKEAYSTNVDQMVIPIDNISYSLHPYGTVGTRLHDSSRPLQMVNASRSSHNLGIVSRSRNHPGPRIILGRVIRIRPLEVLEVDICLQFNPQVHAGHTPCLHPNLWEPVLLISMRL